MTWLDYRRVKDDDLSQLFNWLTKVWYHLNDILEEYCEPDSTIGESILGTYVSGKRFWLQVDVD